MTIAQYAMARVYAQLLAKKKRTPKEEALMRLLAPKRKRV